MGSLKITDFYTGEEIEFIFLLSRTEVCKRLSLSRKTVERLERDGKFPKPNCYVNGLARWTDTTVQNWLNQNNKPKTTQPNFMSKDNVDATQ